MTVISDIFFGHDNVGKSLRLATPVVEQAAGRNGSAVPLDRKFVGARISTNHRLGFTRRIYKRPYKVLLCTSIHNPGPGKWFIPSVTFSHVVRVVRCGSVSMVEHFKLRLSPLALTSVSRLIDRHLPRGLPHPHLLLRFHRSRFPPSHPRSLFCHRVHDSENGMSAW